MKKLMIVSVWLLLSLLLITSGEAFACVVCGTGLEASRKTFIFSTVLLTMAPLVMIGGLVYYVFRASHRQQASTTVDLSSSVDAEDAENNLESNNRTDT